MATISLYYWAGAKAAAGVEVERFDVATVAQALQCARDQRADPRFDAVLSVSSMLVDGSVVRGDALDEEVSGPVRVEILPPFAGGSGAPRSVTG